MARQSLSAKLLVWILPVSLAVAAAISVSTYLIARGVILWETEKGMAAVTQAGAAEARAYFDQRHSDLATVAQSPLFKDHYLNVQYGLTQEAGVYRREIERMLLDLSKRAKAYPRLRYVDASGREVCLIKDGAVAAPAKAYRHEDFFKAVAALPAGQRATSPMLAWQGHAPVVRFGTPLRDESGRLRGAVIFTASLESVIASLGRVHLGMSGRTSLVARPRGSEADGVLSSGAGKLVSIAPVAGTSWAVATVVDRDDFIAPLRWVGRMTLLLSLLAGAALVLLITRQVRVLLAPVRALAEAAQAYARGDLDARVETGGPSEVANLSESFNEMADKLKARTEDLEQRLRELTALHRENARLLAAARESEERYRTAVENSPHAVVSLDQHFRVTLWNRRAEALFGYMPTEAYGRTLALILGEDGYQKLKRQVETEGAIRQSEAGGTTRDGRRLDLNLSWTGQNAGPKGAREWFVVVQDETEKKRLQAQLIHAEKMTAMGNLIAGVTHELNNPLGAITGFCELLKDIPASREVQEDLRYLHDAAMRCHEIVQRLLIFVRKGKAVSRRLPLNQVVQGALAFFEYRLVKTEGIALEVELDPSGPAAGGDARMLQQVLVNLLGNACDALKGRIGQRAVRVGTRATPDGTEAWVEDNGPGVPAADRGRIFEPFFTTKPAGQGTGLGLSISAQIASEFGGTLSCEAGRDGGARFVLRLPPCPAGLTEAEPASALPPPSPGKRVLVVDDEPQLVELMRRLLAEDGLLVSGATNPQTALRQLLKGGFDLVVADVDLGPMRGTALLEAARALDKTPAFVFVTGDVFNASVMDALAPYDAPVLAKPFLRTEFLRLVRRSLRPPASARK